jgi:hypothetical protein
MHSRKNVPQIERATSCITLPNQRLISRVTGHLVPGLFSHTEKEPWRDSVGSVLNSGPLALDAQYGTDGVSHEDQSFVWLGCFRRIWTGPAVGMADFTPRMSASPGTDCSFDFWGRYVGTRNAADVFFAGKGQALTRAALPFPVPDKSRNRTLGIVGSAHVR